jgi:hypothetical protein
MLSFMTADFRIYGLNSHQFTITAQIQNKDGWGKYPLENAKSQYYNLALFKPIRLTVF